MYDLAEIVEESEDQTVVAFMCQGWQECGGEVGEGRWAFEKLTARLLTQMGISDKLNRG